MTRQRLRASWSVRAMIVGACVAAFAVLGGCAVASASGAVSAHKTGSQSEVARPAAQAAVPAACARNGSYVWSHLFQCGWPGPGSTGYSLAACPGRRLLAQGSTPTHIYRVRTRGAIISCRNITGCLSIEAPNVTVRNVNIACTSGRTGLAADGTAVISVEDGASATISRVTINGMRGVHSCIWHQGSAMIANRINCSRVDDGIFSWADTGHNATGNHFTIENSYFHYFTTRTSNGHIDGYQTEGASYGNITHNTYLMTADDQNFTDSAIAIWDSRRSSHDIAVDHNLIAGGGFSIYAEDYSPSESNPGGGYSVNRIQFIDNVFSRRLFGCVGYFGVWYPRGRPTDGWHRSGNYVLETGVKIDNRNPSYGGHVCD